MLNIIARFITQPISKRCVIAPGKLGKGERASNSETFRRHPAGQRIPPGQAWPSSRKRVLRGEERSSLRSVDSQSQGFAIEPRNLPSREPSSLTHAGATSARRNGLARSVLPGSKNTAKGHSGWPGNLGDPAASTDISGSGTGTPTPRCPRPRASAAGSKPRRKGGTAKRRQRSAAGWAVGSRSAP